ncbi:hypothetical protein BCR42DRAFT_339365, partial [Absidia repens]
PPHPPKIMSRPIHPKINVSPHIPQKRPPPYTPKIMSPPIHPQNNVSPHTPPK